MTTIDVAAWRALAILIELISWALTGFRLDIL